MIFLIMIFLIPVFAQVDNSTNVNSIEEELILSNINTELKYVNQNIQNLSDTLNEVMLNTAILDNQRNQNSNTMLIFTTIFGVIIGYMLSELKEISAERREKNKIRNLIKLDFERLNNLAIKDIQTLDKEITKLKQEKNPEELKDPVLNEVYERKRDLEEYLDGFYTNYEFNFWTALIASGSLIKLNEKEIRAVQVARDTIIDESKTINSIHKGMTERMYKHTTAFAQKPKAFRNNLIAELESIKEHSVHAYEICQEEINELKWINLKQLVKQHD